jgi:Fe-S-cluster containining protein
MNKSNSKIKCKGCGWCCKLFVVSLSEEEYKKRKYKLMFDEYIKDFEEAELVGGNLLAQKDDGTCFYLENNRCEIYRDRPQICRNFSCSSKKKQFKDMIVLIKKKRAAKSTIN